MCDLIGFVNLVTNIGETNILQFAMILQSTKKLIFGEMLSLKNWWCIIACEVVCGVR